MLFTYLARAHGYPVYSSKSCQNKMNHVHVHAPAPSPHAVKLVLVELAQGVTPVTADIF